MAEEIVSGVEELSLIFQNLSDAAKGSLLANVACAGAKEVQVNAKLNVKKKFKELSAGGLRQEINVVVVSVSETQARVDVGTNLVYAPIHEFGGVIHPKKGKYLAIPVGTYKGSPRDHDDLSFRGPSSNLVMVDGAGNVQYVLKRSVVIPARPYLRPAADEHKTEIEEQMAGAFRDQIKAVIE